MMYLKSNQQLTNQSPYGGYFNKSEIEKMNPINQAYKYIVQIKPLNQWSFNELNATLMAYANAWETSTPKQATPKHFSKVYLKG